MDVTVFHNRPRNQLGKKGNIKSQIQQAFFRAILPSIEVNHITHRLKGEKRNPDRERKMQPGQISSRQKGIQRIQDKIRIFIIAEQSQITKDG